MNFKLHNLIFYFIILMQTSCVHKMGYVPEYAYFHSKNYPCPDHTINIGDPRFPNYFVCRENRMDGDIVIGLR